MKPTQFSSVRTKRSMRRSTIAALLAGVAIPSAGLAVTASAEPSMWESTHGEWGEVVENFCDVPGLTVVNAGEGDGRMRITTHGPDGLPYFVAVDDTTETWTNAATGAYVTVVASYWSTDHKVTDNGDGTWTVIVNSPGWAVIYNAAGQVLDRRAGLFSYELLIDTAGTPTDTSDDQYSFVGVVQDVGKRYDPCAVFVQAIG